MISWSPWLDMENRRSGRRPDLDAGGSGAKIDIDDVIDAAFEDWDPIVAEQREAPPPAACLEDAMATRDYVLSKRRRVTTKRAPACFGSPFLADELADECLLCPFASRTLSLGRGEHLNCHQLAAENGRTYNAFTKSCRPAPFGRGAVSFEIAAEREALYRLLRRRYVSEHHRIANRHRARNTARKRQARQRPDPIAAIEGSYAAREKALWKHVELRSNHKRLAQLRGREARLALFWKAMQLATLKHGRKASDAEAARIYSELTGEAYSRHQARATRRIVETLEGPDGPWSSFATGAA